MAKDFNVALNDLVDTFKDNTEPSFRQSVVSELRTLAEFINKSDPWPAEIKATEEAIKRGEKSVVVWGTGTPRREFLHVDDLADACFFLLDHYDSPEIINIGCGEDVTIRELVETVCQVLGFQGDLVFDTSKPDGTPRKLLDMSKLFGLGWRPAIALRDGIRGAYESFLKQSPCLQL